MVHYHVTLWEFISFKGINYNILIHDCTWPFNGDVYHLQFIKLQNSVTTQSIQMFT